MRPWVAVLLCAALVSCSSANGWPTKPSIGVAVLEERHEFSCGRWVPSAPPGASTFIDLSFYGTDQTRPPSAAIEAIRAQGGRIIRVFNVPRLRVVMDVAVVERIWSTRTDFALAETVPFPDSFRVPVIVEMRRAFTTGDRTAFEAIGGHVTFTIDRFAGVWLDDDRLADALALADVESIGLSTPFCLPAAPGETGGAAGSTTSGRHKREP